MRIYRCIFSSKLVDHYKVTTEAKVIVGKSVQGSLGIDSSGDMTGAVHVNVGKLGREIQGKMDGPKADHNISTVLSRAIEAMKNTVPTMD